MQPQGSCSLEISWIRASIGEDISNLDFVIFVTVLRGFRVLKMVVKCTSLFLLEVWRMPMQAQA